ncbi:MAG: fumarylacetoacetase [Actinomycetota bacterium]
MTEGFSIENLPYGVFSTGVSPPRCGVAFEEFVVDLSKLEALDELVPKGTFSQPSLNAFLDLGPEVWDRVRIRISENLISRKSDFLIPRSAVTMHLPVFVRDYVDFYSSIQHATNLGRIFRPDADALMPNWRHLPVGYHGRASTIVVSGTPVKRPMGQLGAGRFGPCEKLDFELEIGFISAVPNKLGDPVSVEQARDHIFGVVLVNDWSARDIQSWEYQPLGPFLGKSFATSISAWVVPLAALDPFKLEAPVQDPEPLPYLRPQGHVFDIDLEVELNGEVISRTNAKNLYWTFEQQLAHATVNGAIASSGDLFASGTISGEQEGSYGSLIELTWNGSSPIKVGSELRTFLEDGDTVTIRGSAGNRVGFGEVTGQIKGNVPA